MTLEENLKQTRPFRSIAEKTSLNIIYTGNWLEARIEERVKSFGLATHQQYNILRILKGVHPEGHSIQDIKCRMLDRNSDVSRLVDRLLAQDLVSRQEDPENRRKVIVKISPVGIELINKINPALEELNQFFRNISSEQLEMINELLDRLRSDYQPEQPLECCGGNNEQ